MTTATTEPGVPLDEATMPLLHQAWVDVTTARQEGERKRLKAWNDALEEGVIALGIDTRRPVEAGPAVTLIAGTLEHVARCRLTSQWWASLRRAIAVLFADPKPDDWNLSPVIAPWVGSGHDLHHRLLRYLWPSEGALPIDESFEPLNESLGIRAGSPQWYTVRPALADLDRAGLLTLHDDGYGLSPRGYRVHYLFAPGWYATEEEFQREHVLTTAIPRPECS